MTMSEAWIYAALAAALMLGMAVLVVSGALAKLLADLREMRVRLAMVKDREGNPIRFENGRRARFTPDFRYEEQRADGTWHAVVEDIKSPVTMTEAFQLRAALWRADHPTIELRITT